MITKNLLTVAFFLGLAVSNVFAENAGEITTSPDKAELTISAGSQGTVEQRLEIVNSTMFMEALRVVVTMKDGNLPLSWISASPAGIYQT